MMQFQSSFLMFPVSSILILSAFLQSSNCFLYHGKNRFWTIDIGDKTYFALHQFQGDTKLFFPNQSTFPAISTFTTSHKNCNNTGILNFKFTVDSERYLRGEIRLDGNILSAFMYQDCPEKRNTGNYYGPINMEIHELINTRECFMHGNIPFDRYNVMTNVMDFQVNGSIDCPAFFVLSPSMNLEDETPDEAPIRLPLSSTFAGHEDGFWWKSENDDMLPKGVSFDAENNTVFDINQMNSSDAIFLRIGQNQPIPTFEFSFNHSCSGSTFDLFLNENLSPKCGIGIKLASNGFYIMTKRIAPFFISHLSGPISMVFDAEAVYVKIRDPVSITRYDTCKIVNNPADQLSIRISKDGGDGICENAELRLLSNDVASGIEVLIEQQKFGLASPASNSFQDEGEAASDSVKSDSIQWYWIVGGGVLLLVVIVIICVIITFFCIRRRKGGKIQKKISKREPHQATQNLEDGKKSEKSQKKKSTKSKRQKKQDKSMKKKKTSTEAEEKSIKKRSKKDVIIVKKESQTGEDITNSPQHESSRKKKANQSSKKLHKTQEASAESVLKNRFMYGGECSPIDEPFDYHIGECATFATTLKLEDVQSPNIKAYHNFWDCVKKIAEPQKVNAIYANAKVRYLRVFFFTRDLVADEETYSQFKSLSNRMLEPLKDDLSIGKSTTGTTIDGERKVDFLRVFITSYEPLTLEVHCRGQCPLSLFKLFECEKCAGIAKELQCNDWLKSSATCQEDWETFLCRVKRTPMNSHQFLSYNAGVKPNTTHDVNHILVIRGGQKPKKLRPCIRGCKFSDASHPNPFLFECTQPTLDTQGTQNSS